jgi:hypothetical protein
LDPIVSSISTQVRNIFVCRSIRCITHVVSSVSDSIVYIHRPGQPDLPTGKFLGDLTNELKPNQFITEFVSTGPKSYAYLTNDGKCVCKVKGFTIDGKVEDDINFAKLKDVLFERKEIVVCYPSALKRVKRRFQIEQSSVCKRFKFTYDKRRLLSNFETLPFGYRLA